MHNLFVCQVASCTFYLLAIALTFKSLLCSIHFFFTRFWLAQSHLFVRPNFVWYHPQVIINRLSGPPSYCWLMLDYSLFVRRNGFSYYNIIHTLSLSLLFTYFTDKVILTAKCESKSDKRAKKANKVCGFMRLRSCERHNVICTLDSSMRNNCLAQRGQSSLANFHSLTIMLHLHLLRLPPTYFIITLRPDTQILNQTQNSDQLPLIIPVSLFWFEQKAGSKKTQTVALNNHINKQVYFGHWQFLQLSGI